MPSLLVAPLPQASHAKSRLAQRIVLAPLSCGPGRATLQLLRHEFFTARSAAVRPLLVALAALALGAAASARHPQSGGAVAAQDSDVPYGIGSWDADVFGNHRAVLRLEAPADAVFAHIPWRRPDARPEARHLIVVDAKSGGRILNVERIRITREFGDLVFEAPSAGEYYVYYLPNTGKADDSTFSVLMRVSEDAHYVKVYLQK